MVAEILKDFRADGAVRVARLRNAVARGDPAAVREEAHSIKGSAAQMGAAELAAACQILESDARAGSLGDARAQLETIESLFDAVNRAIGRHPLFGQ
jgi:histidine phosphotransfer protein HptB